MTNWLLSFFYALGRFALGLLLHPYQTMQLLVEQRLFVWISLLPTLLLSFFTLIWKVLLLPALVGLAQIWLAGCSAGSLERVSSLLSFLATWVTVYMILWQVMLFYLLVRFRGVLE